MLIVPYGITAASEKVEHRQADAEIRRLYRRDNGHKWP